ncbi:MAG: hypothetical protein ABFS12_15255, partial [Bacteroidota bacterium]
MRSILSKYWILLVFLITFIQSCVSIDYIDYGDASHEKLNINTNAISLVTYNIKAIYDKEEDQINNLMAFINN